MSEGHPADGDWANIAVDELRRRLVASSAQTKDAVLEEWTRKHADPQRPDSEAHLALSIKELLREFRTENPLPGKAKDGEHVWHQWSHSIAEQYNDGSIVLSMTEDEGKPPDPFLKIAVEV